MAEDTHSGGNGWLAFIVGGLLVVVAVIGYMFYTNGSFSTAQRDIDVKIEAPKMPEAPELPAPNIPAPPAPENVPAPQ